MLTLLLDLRQSFDLFSLTHGCLGAIPMRHRHLKAFFSLYLANDYSVSSPCQRFSLLLVSLECKLLMREITIPNLSFCSNLQPENLKCVNSSDNNSKWLRLLYFLRLLHRRAFSPSLCSAQAWECKKSMLRTQNVYTDWLSQLWSLPSMAVLLEYSFHLLD